MVTNNQEIATRPAEAVARWSPFDELTDLRHRMDELFTRAFGYTPLSRMFPTEPYTFEPPVDLFEKQDAFDAFVSIPGFTPEMIKVNATVDTLTIDGERKALYEENATPRRHGWVTGAGTFRVSYTLPAEILPHKITATFKEGVLHVVMPKSETAVPKLVKVDVKPG